MAEVTYIPKGGMCMVCDHKHSQECHNLNFESMQKISKPDSDGFCVVKCSGFEQTKTRH